MGRVTIDLTKYRNTFGDHVSPGRYRVVVDDVSSDKPSKAGNPMINVWFRIVGGEFDGATIADRLVLTEKALFRVVAFLQALGVATPRKRLSFNTDSWKGKALEVDVRDGEPYNGSVRSEVAGYLRVSMDQASSSAGDGLDEFLAPSDGDTIDVTSDETESAVPPDFAQSTGEDEVLQAFTDAAVHSVSSDVQEDIDLDSIQL